MWHLLTAASEFAYGNRRVNVSGIQNIRLPNSEKKLASFLEYFIYIRLG